MTNMTSFWKEEMKLNSENMWQFRLGSNLDLKDSWKQITIRQVVTHFGDLGGLKQLPGLCKCRD